MLKSSTITIVPLLLAILLIAACGSKAAKQPSEAKTTGDITRPPSFVKQTNEPEAESNPDETVSYDEWRKRREDAAKQVEPSAESPVELEEPDEPTKIP